MHMMTLKGTVPAHSLARPQNQPRQIRTEEGKALDLLVAYLGIWLALTACALLLAATLGVAIGVMSGG